MAWFLAVFGALLGSAVMSEDRWLFGIAVGAALGALLGLVLALGARLRGLEQHLARIQADLAAAARASESPTAAPQAARSAPVGQASSEPRPAPVPASARTATVTTPDTTTAPPPLRASQSASADDPQRTAVDAVRLVAAADRRSGSEAGPNVLVTASRWLRRVLFEGNVPVKIGLLLLMVGAAGALRYAADAGLLRLPIEFRLAAIAAVAVAGLVWGLREAQRRPAFGLSMQGGAIGVLLLVVFAGFRLYGLIPATPAFLLVLILVAGACVLAVRQSAMALAVLGFFGGYLAPVLLSTGSGNHVALFSYYAVLNAAVLVVAWLRPWRALNLLGFAFTFVVGGVWGWQYYRPELFATVEPFLVLFWLFYSLIPVLYALAGRSVEARVDGTLLFGTPLLALPMQAALVDQERTAMALTALVAAAAHVGLAAGCLRNARLARLVQANAGMGLLFATLAIPFALSAGWTAAAWSIEAAGMLWLGHRQQQRRLRLAGLVLLALALIALVVSAFDYRSAASPIDGTLLNLLLLAAAALFGSRLYDRADPTSRLAVVLFSGGLLLWLLAGMRAVDQHWPWTQSEPGLALWLAVSAMLAARLRSVLAWPRLAWALATTTILLLPIALLSDSSSGQGWFDGPRLAWWPALLIAALALPAMRQPFSALLGPAHIALAMTLAFGAGLSLRVTLVRLGVAGDGWLAIATVLPLAVLALLGWRRPHWAGWPVADLFPGWRSIWLGLTASLLGLFWWSGQFLAGDSTPLPWLPLLNPLDLALIAGLIGAAVALREHGGTGGERLWLVWAAGLWLTASTATLRASHHLANLPWSLSMLADRSSQTALTLVWCLLGVIAWVLGSRRGQWPLWAMGAGLLALVLVKLVAIDRQFFGNVAGIVSFLAVGGLLVVVGRLAPSPPRRSQT